MSVALQIATSQLQQAKLILSAHEAVVAMHRDNGDSKAARAAQARVNGLRTAVGKAAFRVRCAEGAI